MQEGGGGGGQAILGPSVRFNGRPPELKTDATGHTPELKTDATGHTPELKTDAKGRNLQVLCCAHFAISPFSWESGVVLGDFFLFGGVLEGGVALVLFVGACVGVAACAGGLGEVEDVGVVGCVLCWACCRMLLLLLLLLLLVASWVLVDVVLLVAMPGRFFVAFTTH